MTKAPQLEIQSATTRKAALILRAINHKLRQRMLMLIHEKGKMTVTSIYETMDMEQSLASQHLALLRHAGIVNTERQERFIFYSINYDRIKEINAFSKALIGKL